MEGLVLLVISSDEFKLKNYATVLPLTTTVSDDVGIRLTLDPDSNNGLKKISQIMIDMPATVKETLINLLGRKNVSISGIGILMYS